MSDATNQQIDELLNDEPVTQKEPAKGKKPRNKNDALTTKASEETTNALALKAQELLKAEEESAQALIQAGVSDGLHDAKVMRGGYQLGLLEGLKRSKTEDTRQLLSQKAMVREYTDEMTDISQILEALNEGTDPLDFTGKERIQVSLPTSEGCLNFFA